MHELERNDCQKMWSQYDSKNAREWEIFRVPFKKNETKFEHVSEWVSERDYEYRISESEKCVCVCVCILASICAYVLISTCAKFSERPSQSFFNFRRNFFNKNLTICTPISSVYIIRNNENQFLIWKDLKLDFGFFEMVK